MVIYKPNEVIREVAALLKKWGPPSAADVRAAGSSWAAYEHDNRTGQFRLKTGDVVVLDPAKLRLAVNIAFEGEPEEVT